MIKLEIQLDSFTAIKHKNFIWDLCQYTEWVEEQTSYMLLTKVLFFSVSKDGKELFINEENSNKRTNYMKVYSIPVEHIKWIRFPKCKTWSEKLFTNPFKKD